MNEFYDLEQKIATNPRLDFGNLFSQTFELFKQIWGMGALFFLFYILGAMGLMLIVILPVSLLSTTINEVSSGNADVGLVGGIVILAAVLLALIAILTLVTGLFAGFYLGCKNADIGEGFEAGDYFTFFRSEHIKGTIGIGLASFVVILISALLCYFPIFYSSIPVGYFAVIYAFNPHLSTFEIVKLSFKLGTNKWGITFGLTLLLGMMGYLGGALLCGVGIFFTLSIGLIPKYFIYKEVVGFDAENLDPLDQIGSGDPFDY